jgi:ABC-type Na+ transport system ATPase subunit NatA
MNTFKSFLLFEFRRSLTRRNLITILLFFILSMYLTNTGVQQYKEIMKNKNEFQEVEKLKVKQLNNYDQYGGYGFRLYFMPSVLSIFSNNTNLFTELSASIDVGEKLNIEDSFKGKKVFAQQPGRWLDFSGIVLLFGSLIALFYGYDAFCHKEYLKFLASLYGHRQVYFYTWLSRMIWLGLYFIIVAAAALTLTLLNRIPLANSEYNYFLIFIPVMLLAIVFFFSMGTIAGSMKSKLKNLTIILTWFISVYLLPVGLNQIIEEKSDEISSNYEAELGKLTTLMDFERDARDAVKDNIRQIQKLRELSKNTPPELLNLKQLMDLEKRITGEIEFLDRLEYKNLVQKQSLRALKDFKNWVLEQKKTELKRVEGLEIFEKWSSAENEIKKLRGKISETQKIMMKRFNEKDSPKIQAIETNVEAGLRSNIKAYQYTSAFFPTTYYLAVNNEISSRGYQNILGFHQYARKIKEKFFEFLKPRKLDELNARNRGESIKVESFFEVNRDQKNVFGGKSQLPETFWVGLLITLIWIIGASLWSYSKYKKSLFPLPEKKIEGLKDLEIDLNKGESNVMLSTDETLSQHLYNVLSGKNREFSGKLIYEGDNLVGKNKRNEFVYLFHPKEMPVDINVKGFISFIGKTLKVPKDQLMQLHEKLKLEKYGEKKFSALETDEEKGIILFEAAKLKKCGIYMIDDFARGMPSDFIKEFIKRLEELKHQGAAILYLTNDALMARRIGDYITFLKKDAALMAIKF